MTRQTEQLSDLFLARVSELLEQYLGRFPEERRHLSILIEQLLHNDRRLCDRKNMRGHLTASGLLLDRNCESVLLIYHNFLQCWLQPGGHLEPEEMPAQGALREFSEETGIEALELHPWHTGSLIPIDVDTHHIPVSEKKGEGEHYHHDFQYLLELRDCHSNSPIDGSQLPKLNLAIDEISKYRWVPIDELLGGDFDGRLKRSLSKVKRLIKQI